MIEEVENICDIIEDLKRQARKNRMIECQNNSGMGFTYFQGIIDICQDLLDRICQDHLTREEEKNHREFQ